MGSRIGLIKQTFPDKNNSLFILEKTENEFGITLLIKIKTQLIKKFKAFLEKVAFTYSFISATIHIEIPAKHLLAFVYGYEEVYLGKNKRATHFSFAQHDEQGLVTIENEREDKELLVKFIKQFCARHKLTIQLNKENQWIKSSR
jgi:hypothetical protein